MLALLGLNLIATASVGAELDGAAIERLTGLKGSYSEANQVFKVTEPRTDITIRVGGRPLAPFMGLTSWAAFTPAKAAEAMVMGDLVLLAGEVNPVMSAALDAGLNVTALHNHFLLDEPRVYFLHIDGTGSATVLAKAVGVTFDRAREIRARSAPASGLTTPALTMSANTISAAPLNAIFGVTGQTSDGMYKLVSGRVATMHDGTAVGAGMGVNTWAAFGGSNDTAIVDGDFVVLEDELQPVLRSLRGDGINIVAIHHHMTNETPRYIFLHYWGQGSARELAQALQAALALQDAGLSAHPEDTLPLPLRAVADIRLPGGTTRFDYQSFDPQRHLLFIAHLGDSAVTVFNTDTQSVVGEVAGVSRVHGVLAIPALGRVYASAADSDEVVVIDEADLRIIGRIPVGRYPDGLAWAPESRKVYVSDLKGQTVSVIDTRTNTRLTAIPVGGDVGNTQYDPVSQHIFSNVQTQREVVEIDPQTDRVIGRHKLAGADGNHGLLIDPSGRLMFVACERNSTLLTVDMRTMTVISSHAVGSVPDVLAFDPAIRLLYVATESGLVSVFREEADSGLTLLGQGLLAPGAHSVAVDPATHRLYFPLREVDGHPQLRIMAPSPGLLVTEPGKPAQ